MVVAGNHHEEIVFHLIEHPCSPLVLGCPWLSRCNPQIDWTKEEIRSWSTFCHANYICSALFPATPGGHRSPPTTDLSLVPPEYHNLALAFSKEDALSLPPHRPYDYAIELFPGATPRVLIGSSGA